MATTPTYINQRINNLQSQINALQPYPPPELQTLADVLILGNSAGANDIDMNFNDITKVNSIVIDNNAGNTITAGNNQINFVSSVFNPSVISNSSGQDMNVASSATLNLSALGNIDAIATNSFNSTATNDIALTAGTNITLNSAGLGNVELTAPNVNSNGFAMPICFTKSRQDTFSYTLAGQQMELVYNMDINVPPQFFVDNPQSGYTSNIWKIDFALNCFDCSTLGDKGLALYIEFEDQNSAVYTPNTYNFTTPYAVWANASTFSNASFSNFQNFNWSDIVDLSALVNTGSGNLPLRIRLYFAGDNATTNKFIQTITLTRTNLV
jgi:hypothetical protein